MKHHRQESGQAIVLVLVALSLFLIGAVGLGIDASQLYAQRQLAQTAADAAAIAGAMSIFSGTNIGSNAFGSATLNCAAGDTHTPCYYARLNGFDKANDDTVKAEFFGPRTSPKDTAVEPGVNLVNDPSSVPVTLIRVTVLRPVPATLMRLIGGGAASVAAQATAGIVTTVSPVPMLILHPTAAGSLASNGSPNNITICGGPQRSIQVNSCAGTGGSVADGAGDTAPCDKSGDAYQFSGTIDLRKGGPKDDGTCTNGTGGDFGITGTPIPPDPNNILLGSTGNYVEPAAPIPDPLWNLVPNPPADPGPPAFPPCKVGSGKPGCPAGQLFGCIDPNCTLYYPGDYPAGIQIKNDTAIFMPGLYYITGGGFAFAANGNAQMYSPPGCSSDTTFGCGMVIYLTKTGGTFSLQGNPGRSGGIDLRGACDTCTYAGVLVYVAHDAPAQTHSFQGGGGLSLRGTIYMTNGLATMLKDPSHFQQWSFGGNPSGSTNIYGQVIVDELAMSGKPSVIMHLNPQGFLSVRKVALVR
jgi:Flp pilus assembly protein TadG